MKRAHYRIDERGRVHLCVCAVAYHHDDREEVTHVPQALAPASRSGFGRGGRSW